MEAAHYVMSSVAWPCILRTMSINRTCDVAGLPSSSGCGWERVRQLAARIAQPALQHYETLAVMLLDQNSQPKPLFLLC